MNLIKSKFLLKNILSNTYVYLNQMKLHTYMYYNLEKLFNSIF